MNVTSRIWGVAVGTGSMMHFLESDAPDVGASEASAKL